MDRDMPRNWLLLFVLLMTLAPVARLLAQPAVYRLDAVEPSYPSARTGGNYMFNYYLPPVRALG